MCLSQTLEEVPGVGEKAGKRKWGARLFFAVGISVSSGPGSLTAAVAS